MKNRKDPEPHGEWGSFFSGAAAGTLEVAAAESDAATAAEADAAEKTGAGTVMEADKNRVTNAMPGRKRLHFPARGLNLVLLLSVPGFWNSGLFAKNPMMEIYEARRKALMEKLEDGIAVLQNTGNDKNFYYLTGMDEQDAVCMLMPGAAKEFILFVRNVNPLFVLYSGYFAGVEGAMHTFGADTAFSNDQMERTIIEALRGRTRVFFPFNQRDLRDKIMNLLSFPRENYPAHAVNLSPLIHEMRVRKDPSEIALLRQAIDITCEAQTEAMKSATPGCYEYELEAVIEYHFRKNGSEQPGFPSIVGSGPNSTVLHHEKNDRKTENGDLVVMDIGAEYRGYTADVTRTIPVNGRFSPKQKALYEILLKTHKEAVNMIRPGLDTQPCMPDHGTGAL